jgi:sec-independent protein translocase protein TatC
MADTNKKNDLLNSTMSLGDHLEELRTRLVLALLGIGAALIICLFFGKPVIAFIQKPYVDVMGDDAQLQTLGPAEGFTSYVKIALVTGLVFSSPWVFYQLWMFVAAGLYPHEKKYVYFAAPFSAVLFVAGALFFMLIVAPISLSFLVKVNNWLGLKSSWTFPKYISFITTLMLVFGIAFQTPTAIFFLNRTGLVSIEALSRSRKYVILVIVIVAAMATPPDVISQVTLAIPLYFLFELGILLSYIANLREKTQNSKRKD